MEAMTEHAIIELAIVGIIWLTIIKPLFSTLKRKHLPVKDLKEISAYR